MNVISIDEAARLLPQAQRVMVLGCSGSGKSTLSQTLAERLDLRYISMDRDILWLPGWQLRERADQARLMEEAVAGARWVFDGSGPRTMPMRLERADIAIWLRPPRFVSIRGILSRWIRYLGRVRPDMADGCPEKMDMDFFRYVWNFERDHAPRIEQQFALFGANVPVLMLKSHAETAQLLALPGLRS